MPLMRVETHPNGKDGHKVWEGERERESQKTHPLAILRFEDETWLRQIKQKTTEAENDCKRLRERKTWMREKEKDKVRADGRWAERWQQTVLCLESGKVVEGERVCLQFVFFLAKLIWNYYPLLSYFFCPSVEMSIVSRILSLCRQMMLLLWDWMQTNQMWSLLSCAVCYLFFFGAALMIKGRRCLDWSNRLIQCVKVLMMLLLWNVCFITIFFFWLKLWKCFALIFKFKMC